MKTFFLIFLFQFCLGSDVFTTPPKEIFLFIGNPGVGKSTLINSLCNEIVTKSGISAGIGLTQATQTFEKDGKIYVDTPGLSDIKIRSQAALEIEKGLRLNGNYRIFFLITLSSGRIKPDDINTIARVMESINVKAKRFNLIINKISRKEENFLASESQRALLLSGFTERNFLVEDIHFIRHQYEMEYGAEEFIPISNELRDFIYTKSESFLLTAAQVNPMDARTIEELKREQEEHLAQEQEKLRQQQYQQEVLRQQAQALEEQRRNLEEEAERLRRESARLQRECERATKRDDSSDSDGECTLL